MPSEPFSIPGIGFEAGRASERIAALEAKLARERMEAADRIGRLERQLTQARMALPTARDAGAVADNLAVQQQVDALRLALREKDRVIEGLNGTIRGLEDRLEDHYRELDALVLKLTQHDRQRIDAEDRAARAERRLARLSASAEPAGGAPALSGDYSSALTGEGMSQLNPPAGAVAPTDEAPAGDPRPADVAIVPAGWQIEPAAVLNAPTAAELRRAAALTRAGGRPTGTWLRVLLAVLLGAVLVLLVAGGLWWSGVWWPTARPAVAQRVPLSVLVGAGAPGRVQPGHG